jgi:hypothetical protein
VLKFLGGRRRWAEGQTRRYDRVAGELVAMSPERGQRVRLKSQVWAALDRAIREAGVDCEALVALHAAAKSSPTSFVSPRSSTTSSSARAGRRSFITGVQANK